MRKGDWIQTYTGIQFYPLDPRIEEIDIRDIAKALAFICRFTGHSKSFYSVAEHSVRCAMYITKNFREHPRHLEIKKAALLHDAAEAYIGDFSRPLKRSLLQSGITLIKEIEDRLLTMIYEKYGVTIDEQIQSIVNETDLIMLKDEADFLMYDSSVWTELQSVKKGNMPFGDIHIPWTPGKAEYEFKSTFIKVFKVDNAFPPIENKRKPETQWYKGRTATQIPINRDQKIDNLTDDNSPIDDGG